MKKFTFKRKKKEKPEIPFTDPDYVSRNLRRAYFEQFKNDPIAGAFYGAWLHGHPFIIICGVIFLLFLKVFDPLNNSAEFLKSPLLFLEIILMALFLLSVLIAFIASIVIIITTALLPFTIIIRTIIFAVKMPKRKQYLKEKQERELERAKNPLMHQRRTRGAAACAATQDP